MDHPLPDPELALVSELRDLTIAAVRSMGDVADEHLTQALWRPKHAMPQVREFSSGWPSLRKPQPVPSDDAPTNYSALFDMQGSRGDHLILDEIPAFRDLLEFVRSSRDPARFFAGGGLKAVLV